MQWWKAWHYNAKTKSKQRALAPSRQNHIKTDDDTTMGKSERDKFYNSMKMGKIYESENSWIMTIWASLEFAMFSQLRRAMRIRDFHVIWGKSFAIANWNSSEFKGNIANLLDFCSLNNFHRMVGMRNVVIWSKISF